MSVPSDSSLNMENQKSAMTDIVNKAKSFLKKGNDNHKGDGSFESFIAKHHKTIDKSDTLKLFTYLSSGKGLYTLYGFDKSHLDAIYHIASSYYDSASYDDALHLFTFLSVQDQWDDKYTLGSANCLYMLGDYERAYSYYLYCLLFKHECPKRCFYMAECCLKLNKLEEAGQMLEACILSCDASILSQEKLLILAKAKLRIVKDSLKNTASPKVSTNHDKDNNSHS